MALFHNQLRKSVPHFKVHADDARVLDRSNAGIYAVTVIHYGKKEHKAAEGWGCSDIDATYFVNTTTIRRIGGTDIIASRDCEDSWPPDEDI